MGKERRQVQRHDVTRFVWYQAIGDDAGPPIEGLSYIVDVSLGGIGMVTKQPIPQGTLVFVKVIFEAMQHNLSVVGRVAYCRDADSGAYNIGLQFVAVPPDSRAFLARNYS